MILVSFHGGKPSAQVKSPVQNVFAYSDSGGDPTEQTVLNGADAYLKNAELRALAFAYGHLYVVNGKNDDNFILRFEGSASKWDFKEVFAEPQGSGGVNSLLHPYGLVFDGSSYCYVSNQDTGVISRLQVLDSGKSSAAAGLPSGLPSTGTFFSGTFVACSNGQLPNLSPTTPVSTPQGLAVDIQNGKVQHSVRDVLLQNNALYVCDEAAGLVKLYDANGSYLSSSNGVPSPAHLLAHNGQLYVSGGDQVLSSPLSTVPPQFAAVPGVDGSGASGMTFNSKGDKFFVADRKKNEVRSYDVKNGAFSNQKSIISSMPDNPEFLVYVAG